MAKHTNLLWASTSHGKTALLNTFARGLHESTGKKTRVVSAEKAQSEGIFREGIEAGWILPWWIDDNRDVTGSVITPFERMTDAMLGKWPLDAANPLSPLVPAFSTQYRAVCREKDKAGHEGKDVIVYQSEKAPQNTTSLRCPKCSQAVIVETVRQITDKRLEEVGAYFIEGLTEMGAMMMQNMAQRAARGESTGGDIPVRFQDGQMWVGSPTRGHYGTAQNQLKNRVGESKHLPVDYVWWTAGREDGKDSDRNITVFGPKLPGSAATADVPRWFGTTLSSCAVPVAGANGTQAIEYRLYLQKYFCTWIDAIKQMENLVNNRIPPERLRGIPSYVVIDQSKDHVEDIGGMKIRFGERSTVLWDICRLIEERQAPLKVVGK